MDSAERFEGERNIPVAGDHVRIADWAVDANVLALSADEAMFAWDLLAVGSESGARSSVTMDGGLLRTGETSSAVANGGCMRVCVSVIEFVSSKSTSTQSGAADSSVTAVVVLLPCAVRESAILVASQRGLMVPRLKGLSSSRSRTSRA